MENDAAFRGAVLALVIVSIFCALGVAVHGVLVH